MGRKRVPKCSIIVKKEEKYRKIFQVLGKEQSEEKFVEKFKELYPEDWDSIMKRYKAYDRLRKKGKSNPMPEPDQYLSNAYGFYTKKLVKK